MSSEPRIQALLVEDSPADARLLREALLDSGSSRVRLDWAEDLATAIDAIDEKAPDVILLDLGLPESTGLETLERMQETVPGTPIIVLTGLQDDQMAYEAVRVGAQDFLAKDQLDGPTLLRSMRYAVERNQAQQALKLREEQLRQAQKLEAVGRLAGGVAHDFNNLLTAIMGYTDFLREGVGENELLRADVDEVRKAAERGAALTRQLLAFSRKQILQPDVLDVNGVVAELHKLLRRVIAESMELATELESCHGLVLADRTQIEQVLVNLVVNARDAMPNGGRICIRTEDVHLDHAEAQRYDDLDPGNYVLLSVSDQGRGMEPDVLEQVFEPFFTTKPQGEGTGLGLATVYGIVKQSGGAIHAESAPGRGTTFTVLLPCTGDTEARDDAEASDEWSMPGTECILVVEDEDSVRTLAVRALQRLGYEVHCAATAGEGMRIAQSLGTRLHMLVTDVVLPDVSGDKLASHVRSELPDLRVLFMSGFLDSPAVRNGVLGTGMPFLQKPFSPVHLAQQVRMALDSK